MRELKGRIAVVTGGASGIGRAMATRFVREGMHVVIADIEQGALDATAREIGAHAVRTDVSDPASVEALARAVIDRHGTVHVVCNNAGVGGAGLVKDLTLKDWTWVLNVNLWGVIHGVQAFLPHLIANGSEAHIVNTASIAGVLAFTGIPAPYNVSKYGVVALSETLRSELADTNVRVSVLCPGVIKTNITKSGRNRPAELRNERRAPESARHQGRQMMDALRLTGNDAILEPDHAADIVVRGLHDERFWLFTHPGMLTYLAERHADMMAQH